MGLPVYGMRVMFGYVVNPGDIVQVPGELTIAVFLLGVFLFVMVLSGFPLLEVEWMVWLLLVLLLGFPVSLWKNQGVGCQSIYEI